MNLFRCLNSLAKHLELLNVNEPLEAGNKRSQSDNESSPKHSQIKLSEADLSEIAKDFVKEQYKQRRQEIEGYVKRIEDDIRNSLLLTGAIWSWLAINYENLGNLGKFEGAIVFMPLGLSGFLAGRYRIMDKIISWNAEYLRQLETTTKLSTLGWECWIFEQRKKDPATKSKNRLYLAWWVCLIMANTILALLFGYSRNWFSAHSITNFVHVMSSTIAKNIA